jgi:hypothetical protein
MEWLVLYLHSPVCLHWLHTNKYNFTIVHKNCCSKRRSTFKDSHMVNLANKWVLVVSFTLRSPYPRRQISSTGDRTETRAGVNVWKKRINPTPDTNRNPDLAACCLITILTEPSGYQIQFLMLLVSVCKFWIFSLLYISRQWTSSITEHIARRRCTYTLLLWTSVLTPSSIILMWQWFRILTVPLPGNPPVSKPTYGQTIHWVRKLKAIAGLKEQQIILLCSYVWHRVVW